MEAVMKPYIRGEFRRAKEKFHGFPKITRSELVCLVIGVVSVFVAWAVGCWRV
jgi:hypothetical protein